MHLESNEFEPNAFKGRADRAIYFLEILTGKKKLTRILFLFLLRLKLREFLSEDPPRRLLSLKYLQLQ